MISLVSIMRYTIKKQYGLVLSFIFSTLSAVAFAGFVIAAWTDQSYIQSLNLPPEADSTSIPLFTGVLFFLIVGWASIVYHAILLTILLLVKKVKTISPFATIQSSQSSMVRSIQAIAVILLLLIACFFVNVSENINPIATALYSLGALSFLLSCFINASIIISIIDNHK